MLSTYCIVVLYLLDLHCCLESFINIIAIFLLIRCAYIYLSLLYAVYSIMSSFCVVFCLLFFFFFKQKTAYEMRISDWSSDVCSSDLVTAVPAPLSRARPAIPISPAFSPSSHPCRWTSAIPKTQKSARTRAPAPFATAMRRSDMERAPISREHAFMHRFGDGRMREDGVHQFRLGRFQRLADGIALDHLGPFRPDPVHAPHFPRLSLPPPHD